jgi:hypothetical protein
MRPAATAWFAVLLFAVEAAAGKVYSINPEKCARLLANEDCFLEGQTINSDHEPGCIDCLINRPGIETWGCTMDEMEEWCDNGIEMSQSDMLKEEMKGDHGEFKKSLADIDSFSSAHTAEMESVQAKLSKSITSYAKLLEKFDQNSAFTKDESDIMDALLKKPKGGGLVFKALGKARVESYDDSADELQKKVLV